MAASTNPQTPTTGPASAGAPPAAALHTITLTFPHAAVAVSVPSGWVVSHTSPPACCMTPPTQCLVRSGADYSGDANGCLLTVTLGDDGKTVDPDSPYPYSGQSKCQHWQTMAESAGHIQGRLGEYRKFHDPCSGATYEQWTIMSSPMIAFWHPVSTESPATLAKQIVDSATLPTEVDARRQVDAGYLKAMTKQADGYHVTIDRVVVNLDGSTTNLNHATYDYRLLSFAQSGGAPCGGCTTLDDYYHQYLKGTHPSDGTKPVNGAFARLVTSSTSGYELNLSPIIPFQA